MMKTTNANGVTGFLIWTGDDYMFRVYGDNHTFKDYTITHCDLQVIIQDEDAYFYEHERGQLFLDHSPRTLVKENDN